MNIENAGRQAKESGQTKKPRLNMYDIDLALVALLVS
jgi:hypothetical protein